MKKYKVGDKIRVRVKSTNRDDPRFAVGKEYDAVVRFDDNHPDYGIHINIPELGIEGSNEFKTAHLDGGDWEIIG